MVGRVVFSEVERRADERFDRLEGLIADLAKRVDEMGARLDARIDEQTARLDGRIDGLGARLDGRIDDLTAQVGRLTEAVAGLRTDREVAQDLAHRVSRIEDRLIARAG